jgi:hypothetical protein
LGLCWRMITTMQATLDVSNALKIVSKKQRGPVANRLRVDDGDDLADVIRAYTTAILRGGAKHRQVKEPIK